MTRQCLRAAAVLLLAAAILFAASCGGGGTTAAFVSGHWSGSMALTTAGDGTPSGEATMDLRQGADFASGALHWAPSTDLPIAGTLSGSSFSFELDFDCSDGLQVTILEGTFSGDTMTISAASGFACLGGGPTLTVKGASGTLERSTEVGPL